MLQWLRDSATWLLAWAVICALVLISRPGKIWLLAQGSWIGVLCVYAGLYVCGIVLPPCFALPERIQSKGLRLVVQLLICLLLAIVVCAVIGLYLF